MIEVRNLTKSYRPKKGDPVQALMGINLKFEEKGLVFILGKSGSGKSTLLNMLGGLDQFDDGEIIVKGKSSKEFVQADFDSYRNTFIGFIFQEYNILNDFTVGANIALAMELQGKKPTNEMLNQILEQVDLKGFADRKPNELSGGQKQRVAIARALIKNPEIIMADEPTGALDSNTGKQVFDTLKELSKEKLVIVVSHDREFAELYGDRVIEMKDGCVISDIKKYTAKASQVNEGIQVINEKIIHIKSGYELTTEDMHMINEYLKNNRENDSFISLDCRTNNKIVEVAQIDENGNQQAFEDTTDENLEIASYEGSKLKLIKSHLPIKNSLKMAAGSMKKKPFRLIMTILLSVVAFSLFGLVNTMSSYDKIKAGTDSIVDSNIDYMAFIKEKEVTQSYGSYYTSENLTEDDIATIRKRFPETIFTPVVRFNDSAIAYESNIADLSKLNPYGEFQYYPSTFRGVATISKDAISQMGYSLEGNLPTSDHELVITKVSAESFIKGGYIDQETDKSQTISNVNEMIGRKIRLSMNSDQLYTITGILDTKYDGSRYEMFTKEQDPTVSGISVYMLQSELNAVFTYSYHNLLYTNQTIYDQVAASNVGVKTYGTTHDLVLEEGENQYSLDTVTEVTDVKKDDILFFDPKQKELGENEIIVSMSVLEQNAKLYSVIVNAQSMDEMKELLLENKDQFEDMVLTVSVYHLKNNWEPNKTEVKLAGVYFDSNGSNANTIVMPEEYLKANELDNSGRYTTVLGKMPESWSEVEQVVSYSFDNGIDGIRYSLSNATSNMLSSVTSLVEDLRNVLLGIGIAFAVFAGLMLMNFITTSISYRKREIGILRAVGARGRDVFVIFFEESAMIALINCFFASCATAVIVNLINMMFRNNYNFSITIFHFGILQVVLMLALCLIVAFVASFFPVYRVSKKKPIEVIRKN